MPKRVTRQQKFERAITRTQEGQYQSALLKALSSKDPQTRLLAQALASRSRFIGNVAGITFHGRRNMYEALGYTREITPNEYRSRFRRNAIASAVVEAYPNATWHGATEVIENTNASEKTAFEKAFIELEKRLNVWSVFRRTDVLAGLGRYACLLLGTPGDLEQPLGRLKDPKDLVYLTPFFEEDAQIDKFDTDINSLRFGLPVYYSIRRLTPSSFRQNTPETVGRRVHYSRVLHVAENLLDDHVYGIPRLESIWNLLDDLEKITGGGSEAYWKRADGGLHVDIDPTFAVNNDGLKEMRENIDKFIHDQDKVLTTRGTKVTQLGSQVSDMKGNADAILEQIAAGKHIPMRILKGTEEGKMAGNQDAEQWDERIKARRRSYAEAQIINPFISRMIAIGALPTVEHFEAKWEELANLNDEQRANIADKWADVNSKMGSEVVTPDEVREVLGRERKSTQTPTGVQPPQPRQNSEGSRWAHVHEAADRFRTGLRASGTEGVRRGPWAR